jgi:hypothetical protein
LDERLWSSVLFLCAGIPEMNQLLRSKFIALFEYRRSSLQFGPLLSNSGQAEANCSLSHSKTILPSLVWQPPLSEVDTEIFGIGPWLPHDSLLWNPKQRNANPLSKLA